jgi:hypothetical protein
VYQLLASISTQDLALRQGPAFAVSFVIASLFYKFGSFALECLAFLATCSSSTPASSWSAA